MAETETPKVTIIDGREPKPTGRPRTIPDYVFPMVQDWREKECLEFKEIGQRLFDRYKIRNSAGDGPANHQAVRRFYLEMKEELKDIVLTKEHQDELGEIAVRSATITAETYGHQIKTFELIQKEAADLARSAYELNFVKDEYGVIQKDENGVPVVADEKIFKRNLEIHRAQLAAYDLALRASPAQMITEYMKVVMEFRKGKDGEQGSKKPSADDLFED